MTKDKDNCSSSDTDEVRLEETLPDDCPMKDSFTITADNEASEDTERHDQLNSSSKSNHASYSSSIEKDGSQHGVPGAVAVPRESTAMKKKLQRKRDAAAAAGVGAGVTEEVTAGVEAT